VSEKADPEVSFEKASKYFLWVAGAVTAFAGLPIALSPVRGFRLALGLDYFDKSPQVFPVIGHWGCMVVALGVLMFLSATRKEIRKSTVVFATFEKSYAVMLALYLLLTDAPYAKNYLLVLFADGSMVFGGIWYLLRSRSLQVD
jgi:hypothetical protein